MAIGFSKYEKPDQRYLILYKQKTTCNKLQRIQLFLVVIYSFVQFKKKTLQNLHNL